MGSVLCNEIPDLSRVKCVKAFDEMGTKNEMIRRGGRNYEKLKLQKSEAQVDFGL